MSAPANGCALRGNHLLNQLSETELQALAPMLEPLELDIKQVIHQRGEAISHVYFPCTVAISALTHMADGSIVEVGTVGNEGVSGVEVVAGAKESLSAYICQIKGDCLRMTVADFQRARDTIPRLNRAVQAYFQAYMSQMIQSVACNRMHSIEQRFSRWILMTQDRVGRAEFMLTQEFIAAMLGVQRPSVSMVANTFQQNGVIEYSRGQMRIVNRQALEQASCECYFNVREQFKRLLGVEYGG